MLIAVCIIAFTLFLAASIIGVREHNAKKKVLEELSLLKSDYDSLQTQAKSSEEMIHNLSEQLTQLGISVSEKESIIKDLSLSTEQLAGENKSLMLKIESANDALKEKTTAYDDLTTEHNESLALIGSLKTEINQREEDIKILKGTLGETQKIFEQATMQFRASLEAKERECEQLRDELDSMDSSILVLQQTVRDQELVIQDLLRQIEDLSSLQKKQPSAADLDEYPFLQRLNVNEIPEFPAEYRTIRYLYSPTEDAHFEIKYANLHSDENKLSTLRVRLFEQLQSDAEHPLLVCSCCKRPVLLSGNSGIKGEIMGFRHFDEGNIHTGEHAGEYYALPKQEDEAELEEMANQFSNYAPVLENYKRYTSFLLLPGVERDHPGDITFVYDGTMVAVLFASAGHPLDFIVRRSKAAVEAGYTPIWILSPTYLAATVMSNRDISVFTQGYICTINDDAVGASIQTGEPCLLARAYYKDEYSFVSLQTFISDSGSSIRALLDRPEWKALSNPPQKRQRISVKKTTKIIPTLPTSKRPSPKPTVKPKDTTKTVRLENTKSVFDYWEGRRFKIKGTLYVEKIGDSWGILDMSTFRYPVLPIYDDIRISDDRSEVILIINDKEPITKKI